MIEYMFDGFVFIDEFDHNFPGYRKKGNSKEYVPIHNYIYWQHTGLIPVKGETVVHHIDSDRHNNEIENLELITLKEHSQIHNKNKDRRIKISKTLNKNRKFPGAHYARGLKTKPWNKVWVAKIRYNKHITFLGRYNDPLSASIIYQFVRNEIYN